MSVAGARQLVTPPPPPGVSRFEGIWVYDATTTMADPGSGRVRANAATSSSTTQLAISRLSDGGTDYTNLFRSLKANDTVYVQDQDVAANFVRHQLTAAATDNTTWFLLPVSYVSSGGGGIGNNAKLLLTFSQTGGAGGGGTAGPVPFACQGRLTTETGMPVSSADRLAQATLYWTPYRGGYVSLYVAGVWTPQTFTQASLSLAAVVAGKNYDVFIFPSGATVGLELSAAWTSDTVRADALGTQDGIFVKAADHSRLWVGIVRAAAAGQTEDSRARRFVCNYYNQVPRVVESTDGVTRTTMSTTYLQIGVVQVEYLSLGENTVLLTGHTLLQAGQGVVIAVGSSPTTKATGAIASILLSSTATVAGLTYLSEIASAGYTPRYFLFRSTDGGNVAASGNAQGFEPPPTTSLVGQLMI